MFIIDDFIKGLYFSFGGNKNIKFVANQITHAQTLNFANRIVNGFLDSNPSQSSIKALIYQIQANLLSGRVSFNGRQLGEESIRFLQDYL